MESTRPATEMAARSAIVYLETRPGRFKLHNFVIFSSVEPTFLHQLHQLRQLLAHPLSTRSRSGRVTSFLGGSSGGRQAIGHVAAVSTASSAAGHHMRPLELDHGSGALQVALQEALRELPEVPRPLPPCSYSTHGDDAPAQRTPCPGRGRGARMCDP